MVDLPPPETGVEYRPCKACRAPLAIVMGPNGKPIPLDLRSPVYELGTDLTGHALAKPAPGRYTSHFATCTDPNRFSKGKRR